MTRSALITGVTGQDGAYLARLLLTKGFDVKGTTRTLSLQGTTNLKALEIYDDIELVVVEPTNGPAIERLIRGDQPSHVYNLAAPSSVAESFKYPSETVKAISLGAINLLEAIRIYSPQSRYYQASSSEMYGNNSLQVQEEHSPFFPQSPYAVGKVCAHLSTGMYRNSQDMYACCGILFNHESPLRGYNFVSRKITHAITRIARKEKICLSLGNVDVRRDFGFAGDYVQAIYMMMNEDTPSNYVIATGRSHSIRDFANKAMDLCGICYEWQGTGVDEICVNTVDDSVIIKIDLELYRPLDIKQTLGNSKRASQRLGWRSTTDFETLVSMMIDADRNSSEER